MRILLDYRPALRERTGVGEFVHQLARALAASAPGAADDLTLLTTSWKDRLSPAAARELPGVTVIDRRVPVRALAWAWNRLEWPPVEWFAGTVDVVHSQTPLLIPAKQAAKVVTIHDLHFLSRPDHSEGEVRRDFPELVQDHARRADQVVVSSHYAAAEVIRRLGVASARVSVCSPGAPPWAAEVRRERADSFGETILFVGTLEPRKNIGGLLTAYERLLDLRPSAPPLVLAGRPRQSVAADLERAHRPPLAGRVTLLGYVTDANRRLLFRSARMLVLPSFEEGFGLPVLEAMACGVPVVVSNRGSLPEVAGEAASPVDPDDPVALARQMARLLEPDAAREASATGLAQSSQYTWDACASAARAAYRTAVAVRMERRR